MQNKEHGELKAALGKRRRDGEPTGQSCASSDDDDAPGDELAFSSMLLAFNEAVLRRGLTKGLQQRITSALDEFWDGGARAEQMISWEPEQFRAALEKAWASGLASFESFLRTTVLPIIAGDAKIAGSSWINGTRLELELGLHFLHFVEVLISGSIESMEQIPPDSLRMCELLLEYGAHPDLGARMSLGDPQNGTALAAAVSQGHAQMTEFLVGHGARLISVVDDSVHDDPTTMPPFPSWTELQIKELRTSILHTAAEHRESLPVIDQLLRYEPRLLDMQDQPGGRTALHVAAEYLNTIVLHHLLCRGANPCLLDSNGSTALQWVLAERDRPIVKGAKEAFWDARMRGRPPSLANEVIEILQEAELNIGVAAVVRSLSASCTAEQRMHLHALFDVTPVLRLVVGYLTPCAAAY